MNRPQMYWFHYLKKRGVDMGSGMPSIKDMAIILNDHLYSDNKSFTRNEAKDFLANEKNKVIKEKNRFDEIISDISCAYFIGNINYGWVKIGKTNNIPSRISSIQTGCPFKLELLAHIPSKNPSKTESKLQGKFKSDRVRGEWFKISEDMIQFINLIREQNEPYKDKINITD